MSRDRTVGDTFFIAFTTRAFATGIPTVLAGTPVVSAYEDASLTQITAGITLGVSHDGVVGFNMLTIVATGGNGFESGKDYQLAITTGTVGGVSVVGEVIGQFSLGLSAAAVDLANGTDGLGALKSDTAATLVDTADMQPKVAKIPLSDGTITWNSTALGSVNAECDTAISDAALATAANLATVDTNVDAILVDTGTTLDTKLNDIQGATFSSVTDSLEAIRDRGDAAWTTGAGGNDRLLMADTTIATLATQTSFTLTAGSADNDAYNNLSIVIEDVSTSTQKAVGMVLDYVGSTKTVTLKEALAFTIATTDKVYILAENSLKSTVANRQLDVTATGAAGIDWGNIENKTTANDLSATDIQLVDTVTTLTGHTVQTGDSFARIGAPAGASVSADIADLPTVAEFNARTLVAASYFDPAADAVANVTLVATTTTNTDMRGTDSANTVVPPSVAQFNARTLVAASYFDPAADTVALVTTTTNVTNQVTADVTAISGDSTAADSLEASMETLVTGTATGVPTTTTMADSTLTEATDDHFNGRVIIWRTGALAQQATDITAYNGTTKTFTFTATTNAASAGDAYVIV